MFYSKELMKNTNSSSSEYVNESYHFPSEEIQGSPQNSLKRIDDHNSTRMHTIETNSRENSHLDSYCIPKNLFSASCKAAGDSKTFGGEDREQPGYSISSEELDHPNSQFVELVEPNKAERDLNNNDWGVINLCEKEARRVQRRSRRRRKKAEEAEIYKQFFMDAKKITKIGKRKASKPRKNMKKQVIRDSKCKGNLEDYTVFDDPENLVFEFESNKENVLGTYISNEGRPSDDCVSSQEEDLMSHFRIKGKTYPLRASKAQDINGQGSQNRLSRDLRGSKILKTSNPTYHPIHSGAKTPLEQQEDISADFVYSVSSKLATRTSKPSSSINYTIFDNFDPHGSHGDSQYKDLGKFKKVTNLNDISEINHVNDLTEIEIQDSQLFLDDKTESDHFNEISEFGDTEHSSSTKNWQEKLQDRGPYHRPSEKTSGAFRPRRRNKDFMHARDPREQPSYTHSSRSPESCACSERQGSSDSDDVDKISNIMNQALKNNEGDTEKLSTIQKENLRKVIQNNLRKPKKDKKQKRGSRNKGFREQLRLRQPQSNQIGNDISTCTQAPELDLSVLQGQNTSIFSTYGELNFQNTMEKIEEVLEKATNIESDHSKSIFIHRRYSEAVQHKKKVQMKKLRKQKRRVLREQIERRDHSPGTQDNDISIAFDPFHSDSQEDSQGDDGFAKRLRSNFVDIVQGMDPVSLMGASFHQILATSIMKSEHCSSRMLPKNNNAEIPHHQPQDLYFDDLTENLNQSRLNSKFYGYKTPLGSIQEEEQGKPYPLTEAGGRKRAGYAGESKNRTEFKNSDFENLQSKKMLMRKGGRRNMAEFKPVGRKKGRKKEEQHPGKSTEYVLGKQPRRRPGYLNEDDDTSASKKVSDFRKNLIDFFDSVVDEDEILNQFKRLADNADPADHPHPNYLSVSLSHFLSSFF